MPPRVPEIRPGPSRRSTCKPVSKVSGLQHGFFGLWVDKFDYFDPFQPYHISQDVRLLR